MSQIDLRSDKNTDERDFILDFGGLTHVVIDTAILTSVSGKKDSAMCRRFENEARLSETAEHMDMFDSNIHTQCDRVYIDRQFDCRS